MAERKKAYEIEVVDFFDGQTEAREVFAGLIAFDISRKGAVKKSREKRTLSGIKPEGVLLCLV